MKKLFLFCDNKALQMYNSHNIKKFRKGDGGVFVLVAGAALGTLVLIGFYLIAKDALGSWGESVKTLVTM